MMLNESSLVTAIKTVKDVMHFVSMSDSMVFCLILINLLALLMDHIDVVN